MSTRPACPSLHTLHTAERQRPTSTPKGVATAHFGELREPLLRFIEDSPVIVGCVAWVTDKDLLGALAARPVALVVQKESWWKKTDVRGAALARRYEALTGGLPASAFPEPLATKTFRGKPVPDETPLAPIACAGHGGVGGFAPLMHHKFIVRCTIVAIEGQERLMPLAVWTGSANFSGNSNDSFENAMEINDPTIAMAYLEEFALVASVSESMNWRSRAAKPGGVGKTFAAPPVATTTVTVRAAGAKRAARKKTAAKRAAQKPRPAAKKAATVSPIRKSAAARPAKKTAPAKRTVKKTAAKKSTTKTARKAS